MANSKSYRTKVRSDSDYDEIPTVVEFNIDETTATEIIRLAGIVKENGLYNVEKFDRRANYLKYDPAQDPENAKDAGDENDVRTEADMINVSETEFWFSAYIRHTDVEIVSKRQRIDDLAKHFGFDMEPAVSFPR